MSRLTRGEVIDPTQVTIAHCYNRTTRRCFLFGDDPLSGKNFDHRKVWIEAILEHFAACFAIDLLCYSILSNHYHLILRTRPDVVESWSDTEVARRWLMICPHRKDDRRQALPPSEPELNSIRNCPEKLAEIRSRLSDLSWWMRLLNQRVAQRANLEDEASGRFFEDRFKAVPLIDEPSLLACAAYVDLNLIRAAMAETLEQSDHSSAQCRINALRSARLAEDGPTSEGSAELSKRVADDRQRVADAFLSPIDLRESSGETGLCVSTTGKRCSDKGFLPMSTETYLELLDWTAPSVSWESEEKLRVRRPQFSSVWDLPHRYGMNW